MKFFRVLSPVAILLLGLSMTSCSKEEMTGNTGSTTVDPADSNDYETLDCSAILGTGDYSSHCSISTNVPTKDIFIPITSSDGCFMNVLADDGSAIYSLIIEIVNSAEIAAENLDATTPLGLEGSNDNNSTTLLVNGVGDKAVLISYEDDDVLNFALMVQKSNANLFLVTSAPIGGAQPCYSTLDEMKIFANAFFENL